MSNPDQHTIFDLLEQTEVGFYAINEQGNILDMNRAMLEMIGVKTSLKVVGTKIFEWLDPEDAAEFKQFMTRCFSNGKCIDFETTLASKDNMITYIMQSGVVEERRSGNVIKVICKNITRRRVIEENLKRTKEKIEESDKLKTAFLSNLSHEIRTPMNAIIGFSELLMSSKIQPEQREKYLNHITNSGNLLLNLIDDIIDVAKIQSGQLVVKKVKTDVNNLLFEIYSSYQQMCKSKKGSDVVVILNQQGSVGSFRLQTDPLRLRQIFTNLLGNALKFTDKGYIEFGFVVEEIDAGKFIKFYVKDTGIGLSGKHKELIFDRFFKIEDDNMKLYRGAGLGLTIAKSLVNYLGGSIWVDSEPGVGSTFYFTIPMTDAELVDAPGMIEEQNFDFDKWEGKHVLIAEDEDINFIFIEELLRKYKLRITRAKNGLEAFNIVQTNVKIDLVLMDIKMPVMDGYKSTGLIKGLNNAIPVVAQTAYALDGEREKILEAGCDDYLAKPIKQNSLFKVINKYLAK